MPVADTLVTRHAGIWLKVWVGSNAWIKEGQHVVPNIKVATWHGAGYPEKDPCKLLAAAARPLLMVWACHTQDVCIHNVND
jgi:hypothetical protein